MYYQVVCQPRRLAAVGVATRVSEELDSKIGETAGYMVRGESRAGPMTKIVFCNYQPPITQQPIT